MEGAATEEQVLPESARASFRADVQGMRAVAVLAVVAFHAGLGLPGGYVGVDVFFVVSGFVIARLLLAQAESGRGVSLRDFYVRRARRLLPALALMTSVTVVATVLVTSPLGEGSQQFALSTALGATLFCANWVLYFGGGGYFGPAEGTNPFLHTWSLSVEEQFYFVLPGVVVLAVWLGSRAVERRPRRTLALLVGVASVASLALSWALTTGRNPLPLGSPERLAFYGTPTRVWEFGAGVLLALAGARIRPGRWAALAAGLAGAGLVALACVRFDEATAFPGVAAAVPVAGTVLLLVAGSVPGPVGAALSWRPLTWIGDRSYGWYLWHWPAIVLGELVRPDVTWLPPVAALAGLGIAAASFRWFEHPIRHDRSIVGWRAVRLAGVCLLVPAVLGAGARLGATTGWGLDEPAEWLETGAGREAGCHAGSDDEPVWPAERCRFGVDGSTGTILLLGDSHGASASTGVVEAGNEIGRDVAVWTRSACPFAAPTDDTAPSCATWQHAALDLVSELQPDLVVIANRSPGYARLTAVRDDRGQLSGGLGDTTARERDRALSDWAASLDAVLRELDRRAVPVLVHLAVPEWQDEFPTGELSLLRPEPRVPSVPVEQLRARRDPVTSFEAELAGSRPLSSSFDPFDTLCPDDPCSPVHDGRWWYFDDNHLSETGSRQLVPGLAEAMGELLARAGRTTGEGL